MTRESQAAYVRSNHLFKRTKIDPSDDVAGAFQKDKEKFKLLQPAIPTTPCSVVDPNTDNMKMLELT